MKGRNVSRRWLAVGALLAAVGPPAFGAGFGIFEQGTKAMGMAGAFTAQADDPSLLFHNAGGLAFVEQREVAAGLTWIKGVEAELEGDNPFPGRGYQAEQELLSELPPHLYWVQPINRSWKWGLGITAPFGLVTEWENPDQFRGRFLSTKAALEAVDVNPTLGLRLGPNLGLGFGAIARFSTVELNRNVGVVNPFTFAVVDAGRLKLESDTDSGYGWNVGVLHKLGRLSWGLSYRSKLEIDYGGEARIGQVLTGNPQLDAVLRTRIPFDTSLPVATSIEFPDMASLGFAYAVTRNLLVETDVNWTGWSSFDEVLIDFRGSHPLTPADSTIPEHWDDAMNYRLGIRWNRGPHTQWRFGYVYDETPQPEEAVSPLLPDADRNGFTVGYGRTGGKLTYDLALMYLLFDERERHRSFAGESDFFGSYNTTAYLFGVTLGWK